MKIKAAVLRESGLPKPYRNSRPLKIETIDLDKPEKRGGSDRNKSGWSVPFRPGGH